MIDDADFFFEIPIAILCCGTMQRLSLSLFSQLNISVLCSRQ